MSSSKQLKNYLDKKYVESMAIALKKAYPAFDDKNFVMSILDHSWKDLELKQRVRKISTNIGKYLKCSYPQQLKILSKVASQFNGLQSFVFPDFVEIYGLEDADASLNALKYFTRFGSSEFAIRHFIKRDPIKVLQLMHEWAFDENEHVRRLASEGCRPRLPWSFKLDILIKNPNLTMPILENLKNDPSLYVRKSVANHLNDISKDHPDLIIAKAKKWVAHADNTDWILKHGMRSLLKSGNQQALKLFNLGKIRTVKVKKARAIKLNNKIGDSIDFEFVLIQSAKSEQYLRLEYAIHYLKKNKTYSKKVFKIVEKKISGGEHLFKKSHSLRQMTTRKHNPGLHRIEIIINGETKATLKFNIIK